MMKMRAVFAVLLAAGAACAFDKLALMPSDEMEQSLVQVLNTLSHVTDSGEVHQYHELLSAEDLLRKMGAQIQKDQSRDEEATMLEQASLSNEAAAFNSRLTAYQAQQDEQQTDLEAKQRSLSTATALVASIKGRIEAVNGSLANIVEDCQTLQRQHEQSTLTVATDKSQVSQMLKLLAEQPCDALDSFIADLRLPGSVSFLELDGDARATLCDCSLLLQIGSDGLSEGCHCSPPPSSPPNPVESECETRRANVQQLLRSLVEQITTGAAKEAAAFDLSHQACYTDMTAAKNQIDTLNINLTTAMRHQAAADGSVSEADRILSTTRATVAATQVAVAALHRQRKQTYTNFVGRYQLRKTQIDLLNKILDLLSQLTRSQYAARHLEIRDCPSLCSRRGICNAGVCECEKGFTGADCSIDVAKTTCPFAAQALPCNAPSCQNADFTALATDSECGAHVCSYCQSSPTDPGCFNAPTALYCAKRERSAGCETVTCPPNPSLALTGVERDAALCGAKRTVNDTFVGCCFNQVLDCVDKCASTQCSSAPPQCPNGLAVRFPLRGCCFDASVDCVDQCAIVQCEDEEPTCPIGQTVRRPYAGCCFNASTDCEDECVDVVCPQSQLPVDVCRAKGLRWGGKVAGCCFSEDDCESGDDSGQSTERTALVSLHASTQGSTWYRASNWGTDVWVCYWTGVECMGQPGSMRVVSLILNSNGLTGSLPTLTMAGLKSVVHIDLSDNSLTGPIPESIGQLSQLQSLKLRRNLLTGPIPPALGSMPNLHTLDVAYNFLQGPVSPVVAAIPGLRCGSNCVCPSANATAVCGAVRNTAHGSQACLPCV